MQNFVGKTKCIAGYMKVANSALITVVCCTYTNVLFSLGDRGFPFNETRTTMIATKTKTFT